MKPDGAAINSQTVDDSLSAPASVFEETGVDNEAFDPELNRQMVVARLREMFDGKLDHPRIQLQVIEKLIRYLKEVYPEAWQNHLMEYLTAAFPDQAKALYDQYLKYSQFTEWVSANYSTLISLNAEERKQLLWAKRRQYFSDQADVVWEMELKAEQMALSLQEIERRQEAPFQDKVNFYLAEINGIYDVQADTYRRSYQQKVMDQFLEVESVQADLRRMTPEARRENLTRFRAAVGLDDEAITRWSQLDSLRDERWEKGRDYMRARQELASVSADPDADSRLDDLRQSYFGAEAEIIKNEEHSGLFRFSQKRVYGKN
ncbi:MAG: hypothetical protein AB1724_14895 [Thermodesulfobacteriota bacterium]